MEPKIYRINKNNYSLFDDMIFWRENGFERKPSQHQFQNRLKNELTNPNLYIYAAMINGRYIGWISLIYIPKVGKWKGHGHIYVDELWVAPNYRGQGFGKMLMKKVVSNEL